MEPDRSTTSATWLTLRVILFFGTPLPLFRCAASMVFTVSVGTDNRPDLRVCHVFDHPVADCFREAITSPEEGGDESRRHRRTRLHRRVAPALTAGPGPHRDRLRPLPAHP